MDTIIGICGKDWALLATDTYAAFSIIKIEDTQDKIFEIDDNKLLATAGEAGSRVNFGEYIQKNLHLNRLRNQGRAMSPHAAANFVRTELSEALRKGPQMVDTVVAGYNKSAETAEMFWIDWFGTLCSSNKAAHGYGSHFVLGLLDRDYKKDMTMEEGLALLKKCFHELKKRFLITQSLFIVKAVTKDGIKMIPQEAF